MVRILAVVLGAVTIAASGWTAYAMKSSPPVTHTHTVIRTATVTKTAPPVTRWQTHTVKVIRWQTQTVNVPDPAAVNCIHALYGNIQSWYQNGGTVPSGWWDERCIAYIP